MRSVVTYQLSVARHFNVATPRSVVGAVRVAVARTDTVFPSAAVFASVAIGYAVGAAGAERFRVGAHRHAIAVRDAAGLRSGDPIGFALCVGLAKRNRLGISRSIAIRPAVSIAHDDALCAANAHRLGDAVSVRVATPTTERSARIIVDDTRSDRFNNIAEPQP